ncbi:hypothetical protein EWF95_02835 [Halonotius roseus]|uniref:Uncharacterized protein n=1 Tax=Halonotius roseus TaxID=2511997 RepID=A0A544QR36_9EURY|nr:hypothetical protein EWF95_02835 [Halonotius roseus]
MASVGDILVSYSRKVQLDQFEPVEYGIEMEVQIEDGDDPADVYREQTTVAEDAVERELARRLARKKADSGDD